MTTTLITGSNRGIGLALCQQLSARGHDLIAACRTPSPALEALTARDGVRNGVRVEASVDITSDASCTALAERLRGTRLDWLIANAGVLQSDSLDSLRLDEVMRQIEVNAVGALRLVSSLVDNLGKGSKVALITSRMGSIADNGSGGYYGYRMSKAALNAAGVSLARDLAPREISVVLLHPGFVRTDMTANSGTVAPADAARQLVQRIDELTLSTSGRFVHANGEALPW
jgi:NAD(P)-dependent dehydrogenase (short-subunit alcohol dehydrogenase family)